MGYDLAVCPPNLWTPMFHRLWPWTVLGLLSHLCLITHLDSMIYKLTCGALVHSQWWSFWSLLDQCLYWAQGNGLISACLLGMGQVCLKKLPIWISIVHRTDYCLMSHMTTILISWAVLDLIQASNSTLFLFLQHLTREYIAQTVLDDMPHLWASHEAYLVSFLLCCHI